MTALIRSLRDVRGITVLLVEHNVKTIMELCQQVVVISFGRKLCEAAPTRCAGMIPSLRPTLAATLLEVRDLVANYGKTQALQGVSLEVAPGVIAALIGANGAGKSTLLKVISGIMNPLSGEIWFDGRRIDGIPGHEIVRLGIAHVPEGRRLFAKMSVLDNLKISSRKDFRPQLEKVFGHFPVLEKERSSGREH